MTTIILDASVALGFCLEDARSFLPVPTLEALESSAIAIPSHFWAEVSNGSLMVERRKRISAADHSQCTALLADLEPHILPISAHEFDEEVFALAKKYQLTIYDACYLYLAMRDEYALLTMDKALKKAA